jgi:hypothetical protein
LNQNEATLSPIPLPDGRIDPPRLMGSVYGALALIIELTEHATLKLRVLRRHGVRVTRKAVEQAISGPDRVLPGLGGRQIAERTLDEGHVLRVVFMREEGNIIVITMYPARRGRY